MIGPVDSREIVIFSSDFTRTRETAEIIHQTLEVKTPLQFAVGLRERDMGEMDLMKVTQNMSPSLFELWREDEEDVDAAKHGTESVAAVAARMSSVVKSKNQEFEGKVVVLVSHQDPLHILYSLFTGRPLARHKEQTPPIGNCDIRELETP